METRTRGENRSGERTVILHVCEEGVDRALENKKPLLSYHVQSNSLL